jgi:hypothetical protein
MNQTQITKLAWGLFIVSSLLAITSWGQTVGWKLDSITPYQLFPLFGLFAWLVMWTHFVIGAFRVRNPSIRKMKLYSRVTGYTVLASLLLHPGILAFQQFRNNQGLPPESYINYVGESMTIAVFFGIIGLTIFLSFEFFDRMKNNKIVKKLGPAISISQSIAMMLIFVHGLRLGTTLGDGWFRVIWIIYGLLLFPCFYIIHKADFSKE